jgi:hypothetical protein
MKEILINFVWPLVKSHLGDKAMWVTILGFILAGLNKWLKLGFDDNFVNTVVLGLASYIVVHFAHTAVNKDKPNA